jgi:hypothetical protein
MNAKKLTLAVASMMVLAAAFLLVVPSETDDAAEIEITDAYFKEGQTGIYVYVYFSETVQSGYMKLFFGDDLVKRVSLLPGKNYISANVGKSLVKGTYDVVIESEFGTKTTQIVYPTPVAHTITVMANPVNGGTIIADKSTAFEGETVTLTITPAENYKLTKVMGVQLIEGTTAFIMPDNDVMAVAMFEPSIVYYDVTFIVSEGITMTKQAVADEILQDVPAAPAIIGAKFIGWFYEGADVAFDFETTPVTQNMTVFAHYGPVGPTDAAKNAIISLGVFEEGKGKVIIVGDGYLSSGTLKVTGTYAAYDEELDLYVAEKVVKVYDITIDEKTDLGIGELDYSDMDFANEFFNITVEYSAEGLEEPAVSAKIYVDGWDVEPDQNDFFAAPSEA